MSRFERIFIPLIALFMLFAAAPVLAGPTCLPSSPPEIQRQFNPNTGQSTGDPEPKCRFLAVTSGDVGQSQTIRVAWDAQPNWPGGHAALVGQQKWMTQPFQVCENSGHGLNTSPPDCGPAPGQPQKWFWAARLTCDPLIASYVDLSTFTDYCSGSGESCTVDNDCSRGTCGVDGAIHIVDQGISPTKRNHQGNNIEAIYSLQILSEGCDINDENNFSAPLIVLQPVWGDVSVGTGCPLSPPNETVGIVNDVVRTINKFSNTFCAVKKTRADMEPASPDMKVSIPDVLV